MHAARALEDMRHQLPRSDNFPGPTYALISGFRDE